MKPFLIMSLLVMLAAPAQAADRDVFAIIVTNNHSNELGRPDLRYADDDGAKYAEMFSMLAPAENVHLLAELDRDTLALFPHLAKVAKQPTRAAVATAANDVARRARTALSAGREVEVYFVFAGHGDVDRGNGFLELADGPLTAAGLDKQILSGIKSTRTHVILDSCNSFFVINARKPGGRRFATPNDVTETFAKKLPHVGVFLSTSAEAEVYEWSELQSGIFSHAVRSGLLGAADVNGDGTITYRELHGFVTIASAKVKNPQYRPNVFSRGPAGKNEVALVDLANVDAVSVTVGPEQTRLTLRDREGLPWIDAHTEKGSTVRLRIPARVAEGGAIDESVVGSGVRSVKARWALPAQVAPTAVAMHTLAPAEQLGEARGPQAMLRMLWEQPFGPGAMATVDVYIPETQVFGVSSEDVERMDLLLNAVSDQQRRQRVMGGYVMLALSAIIGGPYTYLRLVMPEDQTPPRELDYGIAIAAGLTGILGAVNLLSLSDGEKIHADYRHRMTLRRGDDSYIVADTERRLHELSARHARMRNKLEYSGWAIAGLSAASWLAFEVSDPDERLAKVVRPMAAMMIVTGGLVIGTARMARTPEEQMYKLWRDDPGIREIPRLGLAPARSGGMLTLSGSF